MKIDRQPPRRRGQQRLSKEQRTADILGVASEVFRKKGYHDAAIAEIADRLGIVEGTIYRYFSSKRDLLIQVAEDWYEHTLADYDRELKGISGTWNRLRFMVWRHLTVMHDEPGMCRLILGELRNGEDYRKTSVFELNRQYTQRTLAIVEEGVASGEFRGDVPMSIIRAMIYGGVEHHAWAHLRGEGDYSPEQAADDIVNIVYRGLAKQPEQTVPEMERLESVTRRLERLARKSD